MYASKIKKYITFSGNDGSYKIKFLYINTFLKGLKLQIADLAVTLGHSSRKILPCTIPHITSMCTAVKICCKTRQACKRRIFLTRLSLVTNI